MAQRIALNIIFLLSLIPLRMDGASKPEELLRVWSDREVKTQLRVDAAFDYLRLSGISRDSQILVAREVVVFAHKAQQAEWQVEAMHILATKLRLTGKLDEAREIRLEGVSLASRHGLPKLRSFHLTGLGVLATITGKYVEAVDYYQQAIHIADSLQDPGTRALNLGALAIVYWQQGKMNRALKYFTDAAEGHRLAGDHKKYTETLGNLGILYHDQGNYPKALEAYQVALKSYESQGETDDVAMTLSNIAVLHGELGDDTLKVATLRRALALYRKTSNREGIAACLGNLGGAYMSFGHLDTALTCMEEAYAINKELGRHRLAADDLKNMGLLHVEAKRYTEALPYLHDAMQMYEQLQYGKGLVMGRLGLAKAQIGLNRSDEAMRNLSLALPAADTSGFHDLLQEIYLRLHEIYDRRGDFRLAHRYYKRHIQLRDSLYNEANTRKITRLEMEYGFEKEKDSIRIHNERLQLLAENDLRRKKNQRNLIGAGLVLLLIAAGGLMNRYRLLRSKNQVISKKNQQISAEKERSDELLLNILPDETAAELKTQGYVEAKAYEEVTVLFSDFKGFTALSSTLPANELVDLLDYYFKGFDEIITDLGIEKIKTIGDAYMCAEGLVRGRPGNPVAVVEAAVRIMHFVKAKEESAKAKGQPYFDIRIGIHTGPVVAGVVGLKKYAYDIWGDTVNIAARMEQNSETGCINVSAATRQAVEAKAGDKYRFLPRGMLSVKGKGEMEMYYLVYGE